MERVRDAAAPWIGLALLSGALTPAFARASGPPLPQVTTFSIVAADTVDHEWGVAVASRSLAVGSVAPWARTGVGAMATQASAQPGLGPNGLALMERGHAAADALKRLLRTDRDARAVQIGIVDAQGNVAVHTGEGCPGWAGDVKGKGFTIQGNGIPGPEVLDAMTMAFGEAEGSLAERLLAALKAGDEAVGARGNQSAALLVVKAGGGYRGGNDRLVDLRVDDHADPVRELARIYSLHAAFYLPAVHTRLADEILAAGKRHQADQEYARVVHLYRQAMRQFPQDARLPNGLAWFYVKHRVNLDEAFRLAEGAQRLDRSSWEIEDTLAEIHFARGNMALAHQHARAALELDPKNAYLMNQASRFKEAMEMSERR